MNRPHLNRALVLEDRQHVSDGAGGMISTWATLGTLWAELSAMTGGETGELGMSRSAVRMKITVRAAPVGSSMRPRPDQRFRDGTRVFRIKAVAETEPAGLYLTCFATEEVVT